MQNFSLTLRGWLLVLLSISLLIFGCQPSHFEAEGVVHLTLWHGVNPPPNRDVLQVLVDRFNSEHLEIQVESLYIGQGDQQMPKILAAVVGNAAPDMLWYAPMLTGQLVELGAIRPLENFLQNSALKEQVDPALFESMELEQHVWSVPFGTNNVGIFYRPSLFEEAGISQLPSTWEELRQVAQALTRDTDGDGRIDQHGILLPLGKGEWNVFMWLPFLWSSGAELSGTAAESLDIVSSGAIAALQFWRDLVEDGSAILSQPERGYELDAFLAGKVAMQLTGPWTLGQLQATEVDFGVMPIPAQERQATATGGENLFIFKTTPEHEQAAFTFAEYVLSEDFQTQWAIATGYLPVNLQSRQSDQYQKFIAEQPVVNVFLEQTKYGRSRPIFPSYNRLSESLGRAIEATLLGKSSPKAALQTAQERLDLVFGKP